MLNSLLFFNIFSGGINSIAYLSVGVFGLFRPFLSGFFGALCLVWFVLPWPVSFFPLDTCVLMCYHVLVCSCRSGLPGGALCLILLFPFPFPPARVLSLLLLLWPVSLPGLFPWSLALASFAPPGFGFPLSVLLFFPFLALVGFLSPALSPAPPAGLVSGLASLWFPLLPFLVPPLRCLVVALSSLPPVPVPARVAVVLSVGRGAPGREPRPARLVAASGADLRPSSWRLVSSVAGLGGWLVLAPVQPVASQLSLF